MSIYIQRKAFLLAFFLFSFLPFPFLSCLFLSSLSLPFPLPVRPSFLSSAWGIVLKYCPTTCFFHPTLHRGTPLWIGEAHIPQSVACCCQQTWRKRQIPLGGWSCEHLRPNASSCIALSLWAGADSWSGVRKGALSCWSGRLANTGLKGLLRGRYFSQQDWQTPLQNGEKWTQGAWEFKQPLPTWTDGLAFIKTNKQTLFIGMPGSFLHDPRKSQIPFPFFLLFIYF